MIIFIHSSMGCWWWPWMTSTIPINLTTLVVPHKNMFSHRGPEKRVLGWDQPFLSKSFTIPSGQPDGKSPKQIYGVFFHNIIFSKWRIRFTPFFWVPEGSTAPLDDETRWKNPWILANHSVQRLSPWITVVYLRWGHFCPAGDSWTF